MSRIILLTSAVMSLLSVHLIALCDMPPPPCVAMAGATDVFYGEVIESRYFPNHVGPDTISLSGRREVRFNILNRLKGVGAGDVTEIFNYERFEDIELLRGGRYLVYASRRGEQLVTACTRTRPVNPSNAESVKVEIAQLKECTSKDVR